MKLARCARSDSHPVRALRAVKSRPCGAGLHSNGRGAAPVLTCWFSGSAVSRAPQCISAHNARTQVRRVRVRYAGAGPHPSRTFLTCPWKFCVAAFAAPLFVTVGLTRCEDRWEIFSSFIPSGFSRPLCRTVCALGCGPTSFTVRSVQCRGFFPFSLRKKIFLIRRDAPSCLPRFPASFFPALAWVPLSFPASSWPPHSFLVSFLSHAKFCIMKAGT